MVKKKLTQWYFKITDYADRLLDDLNQLEGSWPSKVLAMQRNWIGRSIGAEVDFVIEGRDEPVTVFTTRPDTLFGATFMVVAPDSDLAAELAAGLDARGAEGVRRATSSRCRSRPRSSARMPAARRPASSLERWAINPVNGERIPVWAADYVLADYGHGAVMAVPAHDQRDLDFALQVRLRRARRRRHQRAGHRRDAGHHARDARVRRDCRRSTRWRPARRSAATAG